MKTNHQFILLAIVLWTAMGCRTAKPTRPVESYEERFQSRVSVLDIPVEVSVLALERMLNAQLSGVVYEDNTFDDGDKMQLRATKRDNIRLQLEGMSLRYRVPLGLWIRYDLGLAKVDADGAIALDFRTDLSLGADWSLQTATTLENHQWLETPRVRLGSMGIPVGAIANYVLRRSQGVIAEGIDEQITKQFNLTSYVQQAWKLMHQPYEVSPTYQTWLRVNPTRIGLTPLTTQGGVIRTHIIIEGQPDLSIGPKPATGFVPPLPPFNFQQQSTNQEFVVFVESTVAYTEAERLVRQTVQGQRFEQGGRHVVVRDIELYGQGTQLVVNLTLDGSYRGNIYLTGRPEFNPRTNTVDIKDLNYTLDTRNVLVRSAGWLLKSTLRAKIQENMDFLLSSNLDDIQRQIQSQLNHYQLAPGVFIDGELHDLSLYNAYLTTNGIKVSVSLRGDVSVQMQGMR